MNKEINQNCPNPNNTPLEPINWPSKAELLRMLWEKPATHIACELRCSHASVLMRAKALDLPRPGHGYWQKAKVGIEVAVPQEVTQLMQKLANEPVESGGAHGAHRGRARGPRARWHRINWPSKEELQRLVWTKPGTHLARDLGCCYQHISLKAKALGLQMPGNGYWQKRIAMS